MVCEFFRNPQFLQNTGQQRQRQIQKQRQRKEAQDPLKGSFACLPFMVPSCTIY